MIEIKNDYDSVIQELNRLEVIWDFCADRLYSLEEISGLRRKEYKKQRKNFADSLKTVSDAVNNIVVQCSGLNNATLEQSVKEELNDLESYVNANKSTKPSFFNKIRNVLRKGSRVEVIALDDQERIGQGGACASLSAQETTQTKSEEVSNDEEVIKKTQEDKGEHEESTC